MNQDATRQLLSAVGGVQADVKHLSKIAERNTDAIEALRVDMTVVQSQLKEKQSFVAGVSSTVSGIWLVVIAVLTLFKEKIFS